MFVLIIIVSVFSNLNPKDHELSQNETPTPTPALPQQILTDAYIIENNGNLKDWELWAKKGTFIESRQDWIIEDIKMIFSGEKKVTYELTGNSGDIITDEKKSLRNVQVIGNIVTKTSTGMIFETDKSFYTKEDRMLNFPNPITVKGPLESDKTRLLINGNKMSLNLNNNEMIIEGNVVGSKTITNRGKAVVQSDKAILNSIKSNAVFSGNVLFLNNGMSIKGSEAEFTYSKNKIKTATIINLLAEDDIKRVKAGKLVVDFEKDIFTFTGNPQVTQADSEINGDEIIFTNGGKRVYVKDVNSTIDPKQVKKLNSF